MHVYEYINHVIDDCINDCQTNYKRLNFLDNIRFNARQPDSSPHSMLYRANDELNLLHAQRVSHNHSCLGDQNLIGLGDCTYIQSMGCNIYLEHQWEPLDINLDQEFWDIMYYHKLQYRSNMYIFHSERNSSDVARLERCGMQGVHWFGHAYLCSEFYFRHYEKLKIVRNYRARPIENAWICANRLIDVARVYRLEFLNMLDINSGTYSLLSKDPQTYRTPNEILPRNCVAPNSFDDHTNSSAEVDVTGTWSKSFLHIVTETIWQKKIHFTEKVFKPIVLHQPFVVLQAPGSLEYLHSYGFKTFSAWWDESYDTIEDPAERMQAIADIVNWIGSKSLNELEKMRTEMADVLEYNFRHFYENIPAICIDELKANLTR